MERSWYYMQDNQQMGPVLQSRLIQLMQEGVVKSDTFIWSEGMADWQPAGQVNFAGEVAGQLRPARPTAVTVFGVLNIVFGGMGLMCTPLAVVAQFLPQPPDAPQVTFPPAMQVYSMFSFGLNVLMAAVLLAAGIGLLKQRRWGRQVSYAYGWFSVIWGVIGMAFVLVMLGGSFGNTGTSGPESMAATSGLVGGMCLGLLGLVYPILLIVYMKKPHVVDACSR